MGLCGPVFDLDDGSGPQREYPLREVFNGLRWIIRAGAPWRMQTIDLPPSHELRNEVVEEFRPDCVGERGIALVSAREAQQK
jgi:transposase